MTGNRVSVVELECGHHTAMLHWGDHAPSGTRVCGECPRIPRPGGDSLAHSRIVAVVEDPSKALYRKGEAVKGESDLSLDREYYEISQLLCDASWEGRWNPLRETNVAPIAAGVAEIVAPALASERSRADRLEQDLERVKTLAEQQHAAIKQTLRWTPIPALCGSGTYWAALLEAHAAHALLASVEENP